MTKSLARPNSDYQIGYCKPPTHTQFKPGQCGNPKGRPKGALTADEILLREAARLVKIESGGKVETVTKIEVVVRQLLKLAANGDLRAISLAMAHYVRLSGAGGGTAGNAADEVLVDLAMPDDEAIQRILQRFTHLFPKPGTPHAAK